MSDIKGWMGKYLSVDLDNKEISVKNTDEALVEKYLGGIGIGTKIVYDEVPEGVDAFDPRNPLVFATGALTATSAPTTGLISATTKSPVTNKMIAMGTANGHFGERLKRSGYDYIVFRGQASELVYLFITEDTIELRDATAYEGLSAYDTHDILKKDMDDSKVSVACIGYSGEKRVRYTGVTVDRGHIISSGGIGAVMGSKNLKAIVVKGKKQVPYADEDAVKTVTKKWVLEMNDKNSTKMLRGMGTSGILQIAHSMGDLTTKNLTTMVFDFEDINGTTYREKHKVKTDPCYRCPANHCRTIELQDGPGKGLVIDDPEFEGVAAIGSNLGVSDGSTMLYLHHLVDDSGMDVRSLGAILGLLIECYEEGLIDKDRLDGLELAWGDGESIAKLIQKIAHREGVGDIFAEGILETADYIGGDALDRAAYVKGGTGFHFHDLRSVWGYAFSHVISSFSGTKEGIGAELGPEPEFGFHEPLNRLAPDRQAEAVYKTANKELLNDCLGICNFSARGYEDSQNLVDTYNAITGKDMTAESLFFSVQRIRVLARAFATRHGLTTEDDTLSKRFLLAPADGPNVGSEMGKHLDRMKQEYYAFMGYEPVSTRPYPEVLKKFDLESVIDDIWERSEMVK